MKYSVIVPVFNRPGEVEELLGSLAACRYGDFEVIVVEDGSSLPCEDVAKAFSEKLDIKYFSKENSGPGQSRNFGSARACGEWLLILDSDVTVPQDWFEAIDAELAAAPCDAFGGPDRSHPSFSPVQKAISYSMTSFFTTGGIRGGKKKLDKFFPRSFNMGIRRDVFKALGGFSEMRFGEDIDLSIRIFEAGYKCRLFPGAWVWHKRRTDLRKFFRQVHNSGIARINLSKRHPGTLKAVHLLPAAFTIGLALLILGAPFFGWFLLPIAAYALLIFCDSCYRHRDCGLAGAIEIGALSVAASFVQLTGYGSGFLRAWWRRCVLGGGEFDAFRRNFYK